MTATNHVLTGALIGVALHNPVVALPVALLSHFVLDTIPHYGNKRVAINSHTFRMILVADMLLAASFLLWTLITQPAYYGLVVACGIAAASPDLMWIPDFVAETWRKRKPSYGPIRRFHSYIQWYQRLPGTLVELVWGVSALVVLHCTLFS